MKQFMFIHVGFETPTSELMDQWRRWFESIRDRQVSQGGFAPGVEISKSGTKRLRHDLDALTGYNLIEAENLEAAERLAADNPFITSIRIYEIR